MSSSQGKCIRVVSNRMRLPFRYADEQRKQQAVVKQIRKDLADKEGQMLKLQHSVWEIVDDATEESHREMSEAWR